MMRCPRADDMRLTSIEAQTAESMKSSVFTHCAACSAGMGVYYKPFGGMRTNLKRKTAA